MQRRDNWESNEKPGNNQVLEQQRRELTQASNCALSYTKNQGLYEYVTREEFDPAKERNKNYQEFRSTDSKQYHAGVWIQRSQSMTNSMLIDFNRQ